MTDDELDRLLAEARKATAEPAPDLMARILADALAEQPQAGAGIAPTYAPPPRRSFWAALAEGFGGGRVLAGLGCAAICGLALGYGDPANLGWLTDGLSADSVTELQLLPGTDFFLSEG